WFSCLFLPICGPGPRSSLRSVPARRLNTRGREIELLDPVCSTSPCTIRQQRRALRRRGVPANDLWLRQTAQPWLASLLSEEFVEVVEDLCAARNPGGVVLGGCANAFDERPDAGDLGAAELVVLEIDIVNDFGDRAESGILKIGTLQ